MNLKQEYQNGVRSIKDENYPVIITQNGKPDGELITPEEYDKLSYQFPISPSAKGVAYLRSLDVGVSNDHLACHFADEEGKQVATKWLEMYHGVGRQICIRARYIEDAVGHYLPQDGGQVICLAAGLSTYPYRAMWKSNIQYYAEIDFPDMTVFKKETIHCLIKKGMISKPLLPVSYLGLDITDDTLMDQLNSNGWDPSRKTVFIIEGVSYYLSCQAIATLIESIARTSCSGSIVIMDYFPQSHSQTDQFKKVMGDIARGGEITLCCPSDEGISDIFRHYQIISDVPDPEIERKYYSGDFCVAEMANILVAKN